MVFTVYREVRILCRLVSSAVMAARLYAPMGVEMAYVWTGPVTRVVIVCSRASGALRQIPENKPPSVPLFLSPLSCEASGM